MGKNKEQQQLLPAFALHLPQAEVGGWGAGLPPPVCGTRWKPGSMATFQKNQTSILTPIATFFCLASKDVTKDNPLRKRAKKRGCVSVCVYVCDVGGREGAGKAACKVCGQSGSCPVLGH